MGPVFEFELLTTARRGRFFALRAGYGLLILMLLWQAHTTYLYESEGLLSPRQTVRYALTAFATIAGGQVALILVLTPALVSGVIADEKQRKTLHYLLTSQLWGAEIVVGKLFSRLLHLYVFLAVGLPIMSMLHLLGGVDFRLVASAFGLAASTAFFLGSLSILVSTKARRVREAMFVTYTLELLWLALPTVLDRLLVYIPEPTIAAVLGSMNEFLRSTSPTPSLGEIISVITSGPSAIIGRVETMMLHQTILGLVFVALASWRLRPIFRAQDDTRRGSLSRWLRARQSFRGRGRPVLKASPMLWKELHTTRRSGLSRVVGSLATLVFVGLTAYYLWGVAYNAYKEWSADGYFVDVNILRSPGRFFLQRYLAVIIPLVFVAWEVGIAGAAAGGITSEMEDDTWTSLTTTDLTGPEIVGAKMWGAIRGARKFGWLIVCLAVFGAWVGALHPIGVAVMLAAGAVFTWFAVALGTRVSLAVKSTGRAQMLTISLLLLMNLAGQAVLGVIDSQAPILFPGFMPVQISRMLVERNFFQRLAKAPWPKVFDPRDINDGPMWTVILSALTILVYAVLAFILTRSALSAFESAAGRARRSTRPHPEDRPIVLLEPSEVPVGAA